MSDEKLSMERRTFLCVLGAAGVTAGIAGCGDGVVPPFTAGNTTDHAENVWKLFGAQNVILGRDASGYFAYSAICTHEATTIAFRTGTACSTPTGCTSQSTTGLTECPLHFSRFGANGEQTRGPAPAGTLLHYQVTITGGVITVTPGVTVAATTRTPAT